MAAYGAATSLLITLSDLRHIDSFQIFGNAVYTLILFLEENREIKRDFEIQIRDAIYEAQDIIGTLKSLAHFFSPSEVEIRKQSLSEDLWMVAQRIVSMAEMTTEEFHHQTLDRKISNSVWKPPDEIRCAVSCPLVGRDEDLIQLKDRLMRGSEGLEVIPIVGIAGIGKTRLADFLLDDPSIRDHFDATGLVRISVKYDKRHTVLDLLGSMKERAGGARVNRLVKHRYKWSDVIHQKTNDQLVKHLHNSLKYKRYLILLDDIREVAIWHDLKELFPDYYNRSRILITTRNVDVTPACPHVLNFVGDEDSLALLVAIVFEDQPCPSHLAVIAKDIARRCRGFPHAVVIVGRLLMFANPIVEYWEKILASIDTCGSHADLMEALMLLTYNHLPQKLKVFLLYMAIFPYTYAISLTELVHLLIAERLTEQKNALFGFFIELAYRYFLIEHFKFKDTFSTRYEIAEEVFHEFLVRKAEEEKFFIVINEDTSYALLQDNNISNQHRRLCIQQNIHAFIKDLSKYNSISYVRSLLYCGPRNLYPLREWSKDFKLLEVFAALKVRFYTFPPEILKSGQLKYLALSCNRQLPATVCNHQNLEILIVSHYRDIKCSGVPSYLPAEICNLNDLWHLRVTGSDLPATPSGNDLLLKNLYQLLDVSAHSCTRNILERIRNLKLLGVRIESSPEDESLSFFSHLDILNHLAVFKCVVMYPDIGSQVFCSSFLAFPFTLEKLTLNGCGLPWEYMRAIASLPELTFLKLKTYAFQGPQWEVKTNEFTKLGFLQLEDMDLEYWTFACSTGSSFQVLKSLSISHCYKLRDIPSIFADSSTLEILEVVDCSTSAMNSALDIKEKILDQGSRSTRFDIYSSKDD